MNKSKIVINIDGACLPKNPRGVATYAFIIRCDRKKLAVESGLAGKPYSKEATNNTAEYTAYIAALTKAEELGLTSEQIEVRSDSQLLVNQLNDKYKVRKPHLVILHKRATKLGKQFSKLNVKWIPREENEEADNLTEREYWMYLDKSGKHQ